MRNFLLLAGVIFLAACNSSTTTESDSMGSMGPTDSMATKSSDENVNYPYTAAYSSKFEMGESKNVETVLNLWKAWDNGNLSSMKDAFADSVTMFFATGDMMAGNRDTILAMSQSFRDNYAKVESRVDAVMPLKSIDKNEQWVGVWGMETTTDKKGKIDSTNLQETWRLDNNGKINLVYQYAAKTATPKMKK